MMSYLVRWMVCWSELLQAAVGVLTLGFWHPIGLTMWIGELYANHILKTSHE